MKNKQQTCTLCPRECGAARSLGETGLCGAGSSMVVARAALHMWEEPCISGTRGSGAVFFSGCALGCIFCQNYEISGNLKHSSSLPGKEVSERNLADIFLRLENEGAHNINLVTAGHFIPQLITSLRMAKEDGLSLPVVYNSSGYEKADAIRMLDGLVDVYLPDFKYMDRELAERLSLAYNYPDVAKEAIAEMVRQVEKKGFSFSEDGIMTSGIIVRHLVLPGHVRQSKEVLDYCLGTYGNRIYMSLMNQYTPTKAVAGDPVLRRKVTKREYERVIDYALGLGLVNGFVQEGGAASEEFIPEFDGTGV